MLEINESDHFTHFLKNTFFLLNIRSKWIMMNRGDRKYRVPPPQVLLEFKRNLKKNDSKPNIKTWARTCVPKDD